LTYDMINSLIHPLDHLEFLIKPLPEKGNWIFLLNLLFLD